ncbi:MAG TPA: CHASE3 domain-containing protein, partial [Allocoleopsis sp.]
MTQVIQLSQQHMVPVKEKKQRRLSVGQIVPIGFAIVLSVAGISTTVTEIAKANLTETRKLAAQGFEVKELLRVVEKDLVDAETGQRGYLLTGADRYLEPYEGGRKNLQEHTELLK